jgi:ferredoxin
MIPEGLKNGVKNVFKVIFKTAKNEIAVNALRGETLLKVAHKNRVDLEGACEGSLACSTCHVILSKELYDKLGEPSDREYDLLDQSYGLTSTSRLGCQVKVSKLLDNEVIRIPLATRNITMDGYKPKHHDP